MSGRGGASHRTRGCGRGAPAAAGSGAGRRGPPYSQPARTSPGRRRSGPSDRIARERRGADTGRPDNRRRPPHVSRHDARDYRVHVAGADARRAGGWEREDGHTDQAERSAADGEQRGRLVVQPGQDDGHYWHQVRRAPILPAPILTALIRDITHRLRRSAWRRQHQHRAHRCHYQQRLNRDDPDRENAASTEHHDSRRPSFLGVGQRGRRHRLTCLAAADAAVLAWARRRTLVMGRAVQAPDLGRATEVPACGGLSDLRCYSMM